MEESRRLTDLIFITGPNLLCKLLAVRCVFKKFKIIKSNFQEKNDFGDLLLYLAYSVPLRKLYVTVSKAYNLRPMDITGASGNLF